MDGWCVEQNEICFMRQSRSVKGNSTTHSTGRERITVQHTVQGEKGSEYNTQYRERKDQSTTHSTGKERITVQHTVQGEKG